MSKLWYLDMREENKELIVLEGLEGNQPTELHGLQKVLAPHYEALAAFWWLVFGVVIATLAYRLLQAYYAKPND